MCFFFRSGIASCFIALGLALGTLSVVSTANANDAETRFRAGIEAFQKGDLKTARASFQDSLKVDSDNAVVLYNLGLTEQKDGKIGWALALWRKALALQPDFQPARRAIDFAKGKLERQEIPHEVELWESFRTVTLTYVSANLLLAATALFLFIFGWFFLRYLGLRRLAKLDEKPSPAFPVVATMSGVLFLAGVAMSSAKLYDSSIVRGTVLPKKIEARSSPDPAATALFDLFEGLEVIVRQTNGDWTQVSYPGGSTGWVPRSAIFATQDVVASTNATKAAQ